MRAARSHAIPWLLAFQNRHFVNSCCLLVLCLVFVSDHASNVSFFSYLHRGARICHVACFRVRLGLANQNSLSSAFRHVVCRLFHVWSCGGGMKTPIRHCNYSALWRASASGKGVNACGNVCLVRAARARVRVTFAERIILILLSLPTHELNCMNKCGVLVSSCFFCFVCLGFASFYSVCFFRFRLFSISTTFFATPAKRERHLWFVASTDQTAQII